jgi:hypothetical protein
MKNEVDLYLQSDKDIITTNIKVVNQQEKLNFLEEVLKNINQRGYHISNAIKWKQFVNGI